MDQLENESLRDPALQQQVASWESGTYTAWVIGSSPEGDWPQQQMAMERLTRWIAKHNHRQRMVAVPWGGGQGNATGAVSVLTWRTGYPMSVDFAEGHPTYRPGEYFWGNALHDASVDFVLWLGGVPDFAVPIVQSIREARPALPWYQLSRNVAPFSGAIHLASSALTSNGEPTSQPHGIPRHLIQRPDGMILPANTGATNTASQLELLLRRMTQSQSPVAGQ